MQQTHKKEELTKQFYDEKVTELNNSCDSQISIIKKRANNEYKKHLDDVNQIHIRKFETIDESHKKETQLLNDRINTLRNETHNIHDRNQLMVEKEKDKIKTSLELQHSKLISMLEKSLSTKETTITDLTQIREKERKAREKEKEKEREAREKAIKEAQDIVLNKIDPILKYFQHSNMTDKGDKGENIIRQVLINNYNDASIVDVSGNAHSGDIFFLYNSLKCLIEVKRKKMVTSEDIVKFLSDIETQRSNINCALFISLESQNIPKKGSFCIEVINNIPVLYMYFHDINCIKYAINVFQYLVHTFSKKTNKEIISNEFQRTVKDLISQQYSALVLEKKKIDTVIKQLSSTLQILKKEQYNIDKSLSHITLFYNNNQEMKEIKEIKEEEETEKIKYTSEQIDILKKWIVENNKLPLKNDVMKILNLNFYDMKTQENMKALKKKLDSFRPKKKSK